MRPKWFEKKASMSGVEPANTMRHFMNIQPEPFQMIKCGQKDIELRLYDEKRRQIMIGDEILFHNTATDEQLTVRIKALHIFRSFEDLYKEMPLSRCGYSERDIQSASPADMDVYYPKEKQDLYGVVGIEIQKL